MLTSIWQIWDSVKILYSEVTPKAFHRIANAIYVEKILSTAGLYLGIHYFNAYYPIILSAGCQVFAGFGRGVFHTEHPFLLLDVS